MELSIEIKGYIQDALATKIYAWEKIKTFGLRIGVETRDIRKGRSKREACEYIINNAPKNNAENVIGTLIEMSKRGLWDNDHSKKIILEINPILERTMNCRVDETGKISPIFPILEEEPSLISKKLSFWGFVKTSDSYDQALHTYRVSPKGALSLLRVTIENLTNEILTSNDIIIAANFKDRLTQISKLTVLKTLPSTECSSCHAKKADSEFNYSYDLYGLLSYYGSHTGLADDALATFLYTSTSAFIWFLINRYKHLPKHNTHTSDPQ